MAAIAFDTLAYAKRLRAAGVPKEQAEAQAELMAEAFVFNMDSLVTKDYLEAVLDARLGELERRMDQRFNAVEIKFAALDGKFIGIEGKFRLAYWMLGVIIASTTLPQLVALFSR